MTEGSFTQRTHHQRLLVLVLVLLGVSLWWARVHVDETRLVDWNRPHRVLACPLLAPGVEEPPPAERLASAGAELERWMAEQWSRWRSGDDPPITFELAEPVRLAERPPRLPEPEDGFFTRWRQTSRFLRFFRDQDEHFPSPWDDASRVYVVFHRPGDSTLAHRHSVGTRRGRRGVVFATTAEDDWGNVLAVIAHETLHTIGALDHRTPDGHVAWPEGYAQPGEAPTYPQEQAEIMALGVPTSPTEELWVDSLADVVLGRWTAAEIGWLPPP